MFQSTVATSPRTIRAVWVDDDNFFLKWVVPEMFKIAGDILKITEFVSPGPALAAIRADMPNIILTNLIMAPICGVEFIQRVRSASKKVPIIVISARNQRQIVDDVTNAGATSFLYKGELNSEGGLCKLAAEIDILTHPSTLKYAM